ncbi:MAG: nitroreductase family protein [Clostridia bacterium]|nr:nitroreductase family protein [Clostridia bacterium]
MKIQAIETRRSIRKFKPDAVPKEQLVQILEAARIAPSSRNGQTWKFLVLGPETKERALNAMDMGIRAKMAAGGNRQTLAGAAHTLRIMRSAPALVFVVNPEAGHMLEGTDGMEHAMELLDTVSVGAAVENMILEAEAIGLGTLWIGFTIVAYDEIVRELGIDGQLLCSVAIGYPDEQPAARPRKDFDEIVEWLP